MKIGKSGVEIEYLGHSGILIKCADGKKIIIDPCNLGSLSRDVGKADIILITHSHHNSCSIKDIGNVIDSENGAVVLCPADCQSKILKVKNVDLNVVELGDKAEFAGGNIKIETVSAYNKYRDDHPKSEGWIGYIIKVSNVVIYHAGDTDFIPEMQKLSGYGKHGNDFVALFPVSGKTVMNAEQASDAASVISPDLAIPTNYSKISDAERFVELCEEKNIRAQILEKI